ncbi:Phloem protein 2-like A10 [Apostasia shenzhenica]|uniref:Phloem protein 2-like A10 n=1 Tax=Apostasia shenzhenica TaxID=1088818 RepID=A0A2I0BFC8_9ASPA|nr:Phloem protein 2-like A10 [Apostasia shenzhenica]
MGRLTSLIDYVFHSPPHRTLKTLAASFAICLGPPMASGFAETALAFSRHRRRWILLLAAASISGCGAYWIYHRPSVAAKRRKLVKLFRAFVSVSEAISSSSDAVCLLSSDLSRFLHSETNEIPQSLRQAAKIVGSDEFSSSVCCVSEAMTVGIVRGLRCASNSPSGELETSSSFSDRLLDKLFSTEGTGFTSVVVGSFARNMVMAFYSRREAIDPRAESDSGDVPEWVNLMTSEKCRKLIADSIQLFVSTAVAVYLEKTMEVNTYDDFFSGLTNPRHESHVKDIMVSVCNGAVETLVKTYHGVLSRSNSSSSKDFKPVDRQVLPPLGSPEVKVKERSRWVEQVSSVLAVPSNRQLFLDVTGRLTFESVRSFLEFFLWKFQAGVKMGASLVHEEVVERSLDVMRYLNAKAMFTISLCFALCMRIAAGPRVLMMA